MFAYILGVFWIALGVLWLWKPHILRSRTGRKTVRRLRWPVYILIAFVAINLIKLALAVEGLIYKIISLGAVLFLIKAAFSLQSKASERFFEWWSNLPLLVFRLIALSSLGTGIALIWFRK